MDYGLGSEDPEELDYYGEIKEEMKQDIREMNRGIKELIRRTCQKSVMRLTFNRSRSH